MHARERPPRREAHLWGEGSAVVSICMRESAHRAEGRTERIRSRSRSAIAGVGALSRARERYCGRTERIRSRSRSAIAGVGALSRARERYRGRGSAIAGVGALLRARERYRGRGSAIAGAPRGLGRAAGALSRARRPAAASDAPFREPLATPCVPTESDRPVASRSRQHAIRAAPGRAYLWGKGGGAVVSVCMQSEQPGPSLQVAQSDAARRTPSSRSSMHATICSTEGARACEMHSDALRWHSDALRWHSDGTQMHSDALRCTQMHSDALRWHSDALRCTRMQ